MPKELVAIAVQQPVLQDYEDVPVPEGHVRVKVDFGAPKRGSELTGYHAVRGGRFPMGLGNMCVGRIAEIGDGVEGWSIGDRVAAHGHLKETHTWSAGRLLRLSDRMTWKEAVCYDPAQFALAGIRDGQVRLGDNVAVFGLGAIGQMTVQMAKMAGAALVAAVDPIELRRNVAKNAGADLVLNPTEVDVGEELKNVTGGRGLDVAIETSANYNALDDAIRSVAWGGTVSVVGWMKECKGGLDLGAVAHFNIPNLIFARACSDPNRDHPRWDFGRICDLCWQWLSEGKFQCEGIVSPVVPFAESPEAYQDMDLHPEKSVKLGVAFG
jgi:threonine dehydrogenase-like Zn-dependent dehydrogenase